MIIWMFPASELRVALDGPATLFGFGGAILLERMCFSVRSSRNCLSMPSDCGTKTTTGVLSWEAAHRKYRILLQVCLFLFLRFGSQAICDNMDVPSE